jgi:hypothetical protein
MVSAEAALAGGWRSSYNHRIAGSGLERFGRDGH